MIPDGTRVRLLPQPEEGQPEQFGTVEGDHDGDEDVIMVRLESDYWDEDEVDGLREVPRDLVEILDNEPESENSKHCDAGYMNDMRFGDGPDA